MTGGLMQLVAYGAQDLYLTGDPQITFFKTIYRRHTNFATEYIPQYYKVLPSFTPTQRNSVSVKINRDADLIHDCYVVLDLPDVYSTEDEKFQWVENLGENFIANVDITVNGLLIDKHYSQWLNVWAQLTIDRSKRRAYNTMIGNTPEMRFPPKYNGTYSSGSQPSIYGRRLYIPLFFWYCNNPGLAIPLIALQYTEIYVNIEFRPLNELFTMWYGLSPENFYEFGKTGNTPTTGIPSFDKQLFQAIQDADNPKLVNKTAAEVVDTLEAQGYSPLNYFWYFTNGTDAPENWSQNSYLLVNYIYLDEDERRRFAAVSHEYLITQTQLQEFTGITGINFLEMKINNPVKELYYVTQRTDVYVVNQWNNYTNCLYYSPLDSIEFITNAYNFREQRDFASNGISPCLPTLANQISGDPNAFDLNHLNILLRGKLILNGHDRFDTRDSIFFNALQPYKYHTNSPNEGIYLYNFGINPEGFQPAGTCNFSRINRAQFEVLLRQLVNTEIQYNVNMYALNNNIFRIMGGIGSIVFSN